MQITQFNVTVYPDRNYLGKLTVNIGGYIHKFPVSAKTVENLRAPNPPIGIYQLVKTVIIRPEDDQVFNSFGPAIIFFEATDGPARHAAPNTEGKFVLALHGGETDNSGNLFPTEGGLRLSNAHLEKIVNELMGQRRAKLYLSEERTGIWRRLTGAKTSTRRAPRVSHFRISDPDYSYFHDKGLLGKTLFWLWVYDSFVAPDKSGDTAPFCLGEVVEIREPFQIVSEQEQADQVGKTHQAGEEEVMVQAESLTYVPLADGHDEEDHADHDAPLIVDPFQQTDDHRPAVHEENRVLSFLSERVEEDQRAVPATSRETVDTMAIEQVTEEVSQVSSGTSY